MSTTPPKSPMPKPHIVIVENAMDVTGGVTSIVRSSEHLRSDFYISFVSPTGSRAIPWLRQRGFEVDELPMREIRKSLWSLALYIPFLLINGRRLRGIIRKRKADLVVNNDFYNLTPVLHRFMPGGTVPYVCFVRFLPSKFPRPLVMMWCGLHKKYASYIIAVSQAVKRELPFQDKVVVAYDQLPAEPVSYQRSSSHVILYPSNFIKGKGHDYALETFARVADRYPTWKLRFVGGDMGLQKNKDFKTALMQRADVLGLQQRVEWQDFAADLGPLYQGAGLVLNFSESESFSLTCFEALYHGRPVIATDCGGPAEIIDAPETGLLVPVGDIDAMAHALDNLLANTARRHEMEEKAYRAVRNKFKEESTVRILGQIYSDSIGIKTPTFNNR